MKDENIGKALRYFRKKANLTQKTVSERTHKSQQWVSDIENNVCTLFWGDAILLCDLYGITPQELADKIDEL